LFSDERPSAPLSGKTIVQYMNLGTRMQQGAEGAQVSAIDLALREYMHVVDVNGDGRDDLVYPGSATSPAMCDNFFIERRTLKNGRLAVSHNGCSVLGAIPTGDPQNWLRLFNDFDGDGAVDYVAWQTFSSNGGGAGDPGGGVANLITASGHDCSAGAPCGSGAGSRHRARQVITTINNGYGAKTLIKYDPLTNAAVYRRAQNSRNLVNTGRGTAVQDLSGPVYVVSRVESDAPTADDPDATSRLYYQYADARIQAGGRGNLGFAEIRTIDPNFSDRHVVTISKYSQVYPFIGLPRETRKVMVASAYSAPACVEQSLETGDQCFHLLGGGTPNLYFTEPGGTLLSFARNLYAANDAHAGVANPYIAATFQATGNPEASVGGIQTLSTSLTYATYEGKYGNATSTDTYIAKGATYASLDALRVAADSIYDEASGVRGNACATGCVKHTRTEGMTYGDDPGNWRLGRLTSSTVRHTRYNASGVALPTKVRSTAFSYYMDGANTGLLKTQTLQPGMGAQEIRSINFYDDYGNAVGGMQCSADVAAIDCDDPGDYNKVLQRPRGSNDAPLTRVHRYTSSVMDSNGRYAVGGVAPYFTDTPGSTTQVDAQSTGSVLTRDALGNVLQAADANGVLASTSYGPLGRNQTSTHQNGAKSATEFHWCTGMVAGASHVAACPPNAVFRQTSYTKGGARSVSFFDRLGRSYFTVTEGFNADVAGSAANTRWSGACTGYDQRGRVIRATNPFFVSVDGDALLPVLNESVSCASGEHPETVTQYDYLDRATRIQLPEHTQSIPAQTETVFDGLVTTTTLWVYRDGNNDGIEESIQLSKTESKDASGMVVQVQDQNQMLTDYAYDSVDQLSTLTRQAGTGTLPIVSSIVYDELGRKISQSDPDAGTSIHAYNAAGEMICTQDARGSATITDYDALGRVWRVSSGHDAGTCHAALLTTSATVMDAGAVPTLSVGASRGVDITVFDTVKRGLPTKTTRWQNTGETYAATDRYLKTFQYDGLARPIGSATMISVVAGGSVDTYTESQTYDAVGRIAKTIDATHGIVENMYSRHGFLRRIRDGGSAGTVYWELLAVNARGQVTRDRHHDNVKITTQRDYNDLTGKLSAILTGEDSAGTLINRVQDLGYRFDASGNLLARADMMQNLQERFIYDNLDRLVYGKVFGINGNPAAFETASIGYDRIGNICSKDGFGYTYAGAAGCGRDNVPGTASNLAGMSPHAVTRRALAGGQHVAYGYDLAGNQISADDSTGTANDRRIRFDADGLADRVEVGAAASPSSVADFRYGPSGRYLRIDNIGASQTVTRYLGNVEWITRPGGIEERKRYIGGFLILTETGAPSAPVRTYRYILDDHLGSLDTLVDQTGTVIERMSFDAHGNRRNASGNGVWDNLIGAYTPTNTTHGFTGHEHIDAANIVHMNGRLYDPALGRMLSADPIVQAPFNAQNLNRYTYVLNNPLSLTDPTGLSWLDDNWRMVAAVAITAVVTTICAGTCGPAVAAATGATASAVACACSQGAAQGAFTALVFYGIGEYFQGVANSTFVGPVSAQHPATLTIAQSSAKVLSHAVAGGVMSRLGGGRFGDGFLSAGIAQALGGKIDAIPGLGAKITTAALVGGAVSAATGGKFASGALTSAFSQAFNGGYHDGDPKYYKRIKANKSFWYLGDDIEATLDLVPGQEVEYEFHVYRKGRELGVFKNGGFIHKHDFEPTAERPFPEGFKQKNFEKMLAIDQGLRVKAGLLTVSADEAASLARKFKTLRIVKGVAPIIGPAISIYLIQSGKSTISGELIENVIPFPFFSGDAGAGSDLGPYGSSYLRSADE
jgi:RHS repeat-associated protein